MGRSKHPVVRMRSVVRAFVNCTSCVYVEPVKRSTYVVPERNGKCFFGAYCTYISVSEHCPPTRGELATYISVSEHCPPTRGELATYTVYRCLNAVHLPEES